jgi:hypothetical protein
MTISSEGSRHKTRKPRYSARRRRLVIKIIFVVISLLVLAAARPIFHWFKVTRAAQLAATGNSLVEAGKLKDGADKFRAALQLDPVSYPALLGAARLGARVGRPETLDLWEQVVKRPEATVKDRQDYAEQLLLAGRPRVAEPIIDALLKSAPDARTLELASRYSRGEGDAVKALQFARLAAKNSPNDSLISFHLAELLASSSDPAERAEARQVLWKIAETPSPYRQAAIESLAAAPELSDAERQRVLDMLGALSPKTVKDGLLQANLRLQLKQVEPATLYNEVISRWTQGDVSDLVEVGLWLNLHHQPERVLSLLPLDTALKNNQLLLVRLDALAALQRWSTVDSVLSRPDLTLDPAVLESFRARSAQEQNTALDAESRWNHAVSLAAGDPSKLRFVANFAEQSGAWPVALRAYDQLAKFPEHAAFAYQATERLGGHAGDLAARRAAAEKITTIGGGNNPNSVAQLAYLNLLAQKDVETNTATVRKLVQQYPDRLAFRVAAALGYLRQHDAGQALEQFKPPPGAPPIDWTKTPASWRVVYAAVLLANEQSDAAQSIIKTIPPKQISAEERALIEVK